MGKALVINGLSVLNPLGKVTFKGVDALLAPYYGLNTSIQKAEKKALNTFVEGLVKASLWEKINSFYPMLGDNLDDVLLEVKDAEGFNLLADMKEKTGAGWSVADRNIMRSDGTYNTSQYYYFSQKTFGIGKAHVVAASQSFTLISMVGGGLLCQSGVGGYKALKLSVGNEDLTSNINLTNYTNRKIIFQYNTETRAAEIYKDGQKEWSTIFTSSSSWTRCTSPFSGTDAKFRFYAQVDNMTEEECATFYTLLDEWLTATGKNE